jgi:ABC-2 type transport system permease protein
MLGVDLDLSPLSLLAVCVLALVGAACFSTFSLIIACIVKTRERFMGIGQILTMPLFFASNAIYPISIMPVWLRIVARGNPLTYEVDALRALMLSNGTSSIGLGFDFIVLGIVTVGLIIFGGWMYPKLAT